MHPVFFNTDRRDGKNLDVFSMENKCVDELYNYCNRTVQNVFCFMVE